MNLRDRLYHLTPAFIGIALGLALSIHSSRQVLFAIALNETIVLMLIGLYPVGLLYWIHLRRLRFGLADMALGFLGFGAALVPLSYLLERSGYPLRNYPIIVLYVEVMVGVGFALALQRRGMLHAKSSTLRLLVFVAHLIAPAMIVPAVIMAWRAVYGGQPVSQRLGLAAFIGWR